MDTRSLPVTTTRPPMRATTSPSRTWGGSSAFAFLLRDFGFFAPSSAAASALPDASCGSRARIVPCSIRSSFFTSTFAPFGTSYSSLYSSVFLMRMRRASPSRTISPTPSISEISACPFGTRASNSSSTRGRPLVMSTPLATPPVWNVRIVSCVPGSPIDCAATMPTASPWVTSEPARRAAPVAVAADAALRLARQRRAHVHPLHPELLRCVRPSASSISSLNAASISPVSGSSRSIAE